MRAASTAWTVSGTKNPGGSSPNDQPPFVAREHTPVDQRRDQLLDEERVPLRPLDDEPAHGAGAVAPEQRVEQPLRPRRRKRLEPRPATSRPTRPSPAADRAARAARS